MGDKAEDYEPGDACGFCWGVGKTFGDYPTPKHLYVTVAGFVGPEAECNGKWIVNQDEGLPCYFWMQSGNVWVAIEFQVANVQYNVKHMGGDVYVRAEGLCELYSEHLGKSMLIS